jgi:hypothetical protein
MIFLLGRPQCSQLAAAVTIYDDYGSRLSEVSPFRSVPLCSFESETPNHPFPLVIENILCIGNMPKAGKFPSADGQFVEQRNGELSFDGIKECSVCRIELLIAAAARTSVIDHIRRVSVKIGVTGIDAAKIRQQRNETTIALVDTVADLVNVRDVVPGQDITDGKIS